MTVSPRSFIRLFSRRPLEKLHPPKALIDAFDADFYRFVYSGLRQLSAEDALAHYLTTGARNGFDPCAEFSTALYLSDNDDVVHANVEPFAHYLMDGKSEGRIAYLSGWGREGGERRPASGLEAFLGTFNAEIYRARNPELGFLGRRALAAHAIVFAPDRPDGVRAKPAAKPNVRAKPAAKPKKQGPAKGPGAKRKLAEVPFDDDARLSPVFKAAAASVDHRAAPQRPAEPPTKVRADNEPLDIDWVIPDFSQGAGGHMTAFRMVRHLENQGHRCTIYIFDPFHHDDADSAYDDIVKYFQCVAADVKFIPSDPSQMRGDAIIATGWHTAHFSATFGHYQARLYFVQDFEPDFYPAGTSRYLAEETYTLGLGAICASPWLEEILRKRYGCFTRSFRLGVDGAIYNARTPAPSRAIDSRLKIAAYVRSGTARRCSDLLGAALHILAQKRADFEVHFFGQLADIAPTVNFRAMNHGILKEGELAALYRECDVGVCLSATNYSLIPQEMMACALPVVELDTPCNTMIYPGEVTTLAQADPAHLASAIDALLADCGRRKAQADAALKWVSELTWDAAGAAVEAGVKAHLARAGGQAPTRAEPAASDHREGAERKPQEQHS